MDFFSKAIISCHDSAVSGHYECQAKQQLVFTNLGKPHALPSGQPPGTWQPPWRSWSAAPSAGVASSSLDCKGSSQRETAHRPVLNTSGNKEQGIRKRANSSTNNSFWKAFKLALNFDHRGMMWLWREGKTGPVDKTRPPNTRQLDTFSEAPRDVCRTPWQLFHGL